MIDCLPCFVSFDLIFFFSFLLLIVATSSSRYESVLLQKPELSDVYRLTLPVSSNRNHVGSELNVSFNFCKGPKSNNEFDDDRLEEVLHQWLQSATTPPTWSFLLSALSESRDE